MWLEYIIHNGKTSRKKKRKFCSVRKFKTLQYLLAIKGSSIKGKEYSR